MLYYIDAQHWSIAQTCWRSEEQQTAAEVPLYLPVGIDSQAQAKCQNLQVNKNSNAGDHRIIECTPYPLFLLCNCRLTRMKSQDDKHWSVSDLCLKRPGKPCRPLGRAKSTPWTNGKRVVTNALFTGMILIPDLISKVKGSQL